MRSEAFRIFDADPEGTAIQPWFHFAMEAEATQSRTILSREVAKHCGVGDYCRMARSQISTSKENWPELSL
jgi:hypothetical protein